MDQVKTVRDELTQNEGRQARLTEIRLALGELEHLVTQRELSPREIIAVAVITELLNETCAAEKRERERLFDNLKLAQKTVATRTPAAHKKSAAKR